MKTTHFLCLLLIGLFISYPTLSQKRGMAYGFHSPKDLEVLAPHVSWWYNWSETPESTVAQVYTDYNFEFVPMTWNGNYNSSKLKSYLSEHPEVKYILAFNEPNFLEQANMTPSEVAAAWPELEAIADEFNLEIVGPAVNFCGDCVSENGTTYDDPVQYLDDFFAACTDCRVDHIAVHTYVNTIGALEWFIDLFQKYDKPIWLTEFAGWEENGVINNVNDQISFMESALEFLDNEPSVFRYAWFIGRTSGGINSYAYIDILGSNGQLTALGEVYAAEPFVRDTERVTELPAIIYAEDYNFMEGISLEKTEDLTGDKNVGYIDAGDWLEYHVNLSEESTLDFYIRIASTQTASIRVGIDDTEALVQALPNTGGWQNWQTISGHQLSLSAGEHVVKLEAITAGFNLNWFGIGQTLEEPELPLSASHASPFHFYPNPSDHTIYISQTHQIQRIEVLTMDGKTIYNQPATQQLNVENWNPGLYWIRVTDLNGHTFSNRIVIQ
ncbi:glycosyl hydrolase [Reichenbachiella ulvae]|uniref:Glycosyl hydrolase n=1 Tax=Reichenbachiella ulvae TaxID=2980104 RepID=A0ABT3CPL4_9BACT|nr:glycosyl hydrolase [Reichenbachiella ulvae]MCV9385516.1 glycosyl hydrolase [Reichenbachiella ulvae]